MDRDEQYNRAVEAAARGETVENLREIIELSRFCRQAFDLHVEAERKRLSAPPAVPLGAIGKAYAERIRANVNK